MKKYIIGSFIAGILVAGFVYQVYVNWQFQSMYQTDHVILGQIIQLINQSQKK